jgi:hypothetical protein
MTETTETTVLALPNKDVATGQLLAITEFQGVVRAHLKEGHDYGTIPGTPRPTLLKPGAEKIVKLLSLADTYEQSYVLRDWEKGFFAYEYKCFLTHIPTAKIWSQGEGACNSKEDRYRWRMAERVCPACGMGAIIKGKAEYGGGWLCFKKKEGCGAKYPEGDPAIEGQAVGRIENPDPYSQVNTILKMAKKRSLVDAALAVGRLSDLFTQDIEDGVVEGMVVTVPEQPQVKPARKQPRPTPVDADTGEIPEPQEATLQRGKKCSVHGSTWANTPDGKVGHPVTGGGFHYRDEVDVVTIDQSGVVTLHDEQEPDLTAQELADLIRSLEGTIEDLEKVLGVTVTSWVKNGQTRRDAVQRYTDVIDAGTL